MELQGSSGDDTIEMYGGSAGNIMVYDLTAGNDLVTIKGGGGHNALTINTNGISNFKLLNDQGRVLLRDSVPAAAPSPFPSSNR